MISRGSDSRSRRMYKFTNKSAWLEQHYCSEHTLSKHSITTKHNYRFCVRIINPLPSPPLKQESPQQKGANRPPAAAAAPAALGVHAFVARVVSARGVSWMRRQLCTWLQLYCRQCRGCADDAQYLASSYTVYTCCCDGRLWTTIWLPLDDQPP